MSDDLRDLLAIRKNQRMNYVCSICYLRKTDVPVRSEADHLIGYLAMVT